MQKEVENNSSTYGKSTKGQGDRETKSAPVENLGTDPGVYFGSSFFFPVELYTFYLSLLSVGINP